MIYIDLLENIESLFGVKCLHNEIKILNALAEAEGSPSLQIMCKTGRSISGHNADIKRLLSLGFITVEKGVEDKRQRIYYLTDEGRKIVDYLELHK